MKKIVVCLVSLVLSCTVADQDSSHHQLCGFDPPQIEVEKAFNHSEGYGATDEQLGCFYDADWEGEYCYIPHKRTFLVKVASDGQDSTWLNQLNLERDVWRIRLNNLGWNVTNTTSTNAEVRIRTFMGPSPQGELARAQYSTYTDFDADLGTWREYTKCEAILYRDEIENASDYIYSTEGERAKFIRNLLDHELSHCSGLAHCENCDEQLMSTVYNRPGPWFTANLSPNSTQLEWMRVYRPH